MVRKRQANEKFARCDVWGRCSRENERTLPRDSADKCGGEAEQSGGVGRSVGRGSRVAEWLLFSFPVPAAAANAPRAGMNSTRPFSEDTEIPIQLVLCPANLPCSNGE